MDIQKLIAASDEQRCLILSQAELRLSCQHGFAEAADARAATLTGVAAALASAGAGVFATCLTADRFSWPLVLAGIVAAVGFAWAAYRALQSARCLAFHPSGYRPSDFDEDIQTSKPMAEIQAVMAEDLDQRLAFNSAQLDARGMLIDRAMALLWQTPLATLGAALMGAVIDVFF